MTAKRVAMYMYNQAYMYMTIIRTSVNKCALVEQLKYMVYMRHFIISARNSLL